MASTLSSSGERVDGGVMAGPGVGSTEPIRLALIVALTRNNGMGAKGTLPWSLPKEMAHFRKATTTTEPGDKEQGKRNAVIMGRKTWQSIPEKFRPLKGRINIVVSRQGGEEAQRALGIDDAQDTHLVGSVGEAVSLLSSIPVRSQLSRTYLMGGAQLYEQVLRTAPQGSILDRLLITRIYDPAYEECDVFLPEFRSPSQVVEEATTHDDKEDVPPQPVISDQATSPWIKASTSEFDEYMGTAVAHGVVEESKTKYELQMWLRRGS